jgi:perosamine synthetase
MFKNRFVSPYFASIGVREVFVLLSGLILSSFRSADSSRSKLHLLIGSYFKNKTIYSYSSARGALSACLNSAGIKHGDEVILSSFTCLAVPTAIISTGATPLYIDIDSKSLNITLDAVKKAVTKNTRAIIVQHTLGSFAPAEEIAQFARENGILIIEDCALALGTKKDGDQVGSFGDAAIFSMELSKTITVGWGGILLINNPKLSNLVKDNYDGINDLSYLKTFRMAIQTMVTGICYKPGIFWISKYIVAIGFKMGLFRVSTPEHENEGIVAADFVSRLSEPQISLAIHQWKRLGEILKSCEENGNRIRSFFKKCGYIPLGNYDEQYISVSPRVSVLVSDRTEAMKWFYSNGIELGSWFDGPLSPVPKAGIFKYQRDDHPHSIAVAEHIVNIPCHSRIRDSDLILIEKLIEQYATNHPEDLKMQNVLSLG